MTRKAISMREKLAAALLEMQRLRGDPIDRDIAKQMTAAQIISLYQFDHAAGYACDGAGNHPTGLTPMLIAEHREKTKKDLGTIAKGKRLRADPPGGAEFRKRVVARILGQDAEGIEKTARRNVIRSRGFDKTKTRTMKGEVRDR